MTGHILWFVAKIQKKTNTSRKSCLEVSDRPKNLLNVQHVDEILCPNNRLPNQLHLSSEIGPFEVEVDENLQKLLIILTNHIVIIDKPLRNFIGFQWILEIFITLNFKWTYLGAEVELVGQTVIGT